MNGLRSLGQGLLLSVLALSTVLGALIIATQESRANSIGPVMPTEIAAVTPGMFDIPTLTPTPTPNPSITSTPTPTPFVCPAPPGNWRAIEFKPLDDSLIVIAQTFQISLQQLIEVNCLDRRPQLSWQFLYVPAPTAVFGATATATSTAMPTLIACATRPGGLRYIVRPGDTLSSIAQTFRVSLNDLLTYNCFTINTWLIAGTAIWLPPYALPITPLPSPTFVPPTWTFTPTPIVISPTPTDTPTPSVTPTTPPVITNTFTPTPTDTPTEVPPTWTDTPTPTATLPPSPTDTPTEAAVPTDTPTPEPTTAPTTSSPVGTPLIR
ncbi:MAG: LysM peptidoglycan-binding domain-containing protein [Anaerolineae bacterium]